MEGLWKGLEKAFADSGISRKVSILNQLVSIKLTNINNVEEYVNEIFLLWNKTKVAGFNIEEDVIASLMLGGLPEEYTSMILGIENSGHELTVDFVKTILLQGIPSLTRAGEEKALSAARGAIRKTNSRYLRH